MQSTLVLRLPLSRARKIFEFHLVRWASNPQILLARGTSPLARLFMNPKWKSNYRRVVSAHPY